MLSTIILLSVAVALLATVTIALVILNFRMADDSKFYQKDIEHQYQTHLEVRSREQEFHDATEAASTTKIAELETQVGNLEQELANAHMSLLLTLDQEQHHA